MKEFGWTPQQVAEQSSKTIEELLFIMSRVDVKLKSEWEEAKRGSTNAN